jgi:hypothetical protein
MATRKGAGAILAIVACPCHLPLYLVLAGVLGVGGATLTGYLLPALTIGFIGGLAILLWPERKSLTVGLAPCCAADSAQTETP